MTLDVRPLAIDNMSLSFRTKNVPASVEDVKRLEIRTGGLPSDYRKFLLECNGGEFPDRSRFRVENGEWSILKRLFSISELPDEASRLSESIASDFLPIGSDIGGNRLCICVKGEVSGHVVFWDHEHGKDDPEDDFEPVFFVANTFQIFLDSLRPDSVHRVGRIEELGMNGTVQEFEGGSAEEGRFLKLMSTGAQ